jgi:starch synthase
VELKQRSSDLGLSGVDFKGYVEGPEKALCFSEASAFCFLSYTEGMPNAVLEAMAMGLPLVSSDAGGLKDILSDGVTGHIVKQDRSQPIGQRFSAVEVADRLESLADSTETAKQMGESNKRYACERFSASKVAARLDAIYHEICCGSEIDSCPKAEL